MKNFLRKKNYAKKKSKETFCLVPLSLPSLNCKAKIFFLLKKSISGDAAPFPVPAEVI